VFPEAIRMGELLLMAVTGIAEASVIVGVARHMWLPVMCRRVGRPSRKVTSFEWRLHNGRAIRALAVILFMAGAAQTLIVHFDESLTIRSTLWIAATSLAFISWTLLDRRRWEVGVT
jgi:hypothetical protein